MVYILGGNNVISERAITSFNPSSNTISFSDYDCNSAYNVYSVINNIMALNRKGEYYIHKSGTSKIYYWPINDANELSYGSMGFAFHLKGNSHIEIDGFEIRGTSGTAIFSRPGFGISSPEGRYSHVIIKNNNISYSKGSGISLSYCSNCLVEGNKVEYAYDKGIILSGSMSSNIYLYNSSINENYVLKTQGTAIDYYAAIDSNVTENIVVNCSGQHGNGITIYQGSKRVLVEGNKIYGTIRAMTFNDGQDHIIRNNFADTTVWPWSTPQSGYIFEGNTFLGGVGGCSPPCLNHEGFTFRNNVLGSIANYNSESKNMVYQNNLYLYGSTHDVSEISYPNSDLLFIDKSNGDYHPVDVSPACDMSTTGSYVGFYPCERPVGCKNVDGDSFYKSGSCSHGLATDCNDNSASVYPGAPETCGNGIDEDCVAGDKKCLTTGMALDVGLENNLQDDSGYNIPISGGANPVMFLAR
jgi:parallel beta-helix repeat protein